MRFSMATNNTEAVPADPAGTWTWRPGDRCTVIGGDFEYGSHFAIEALHNVSLKSSQHVGVALLS